MIKLAVLVCKEDMLLKSKKSVVLKHVQQYKEQSINRLISSGEITNTHHPVVFGKLSQNFVPKKELRTGSKGGFKKTDPEMLVFLELPSEEDS